MRADIVDADSSHLDEIAQIERDSFSDPWSKAGFEGSLAAKGEIFLAALDEDTVVGYIIGSCDGFQGYIENIAVKAEKRRQGICTALLNGFADRLDDTADNIVLEVRKSNLSAIKAYEGYGFNKIGIRKNFYESPVEDAVVMQCGLLKQGH